MDRRRKSQVNHRKKSKQNKYKDERHHTKSKKSGKQGKKSSTKADKHLKQKRKKRSIWIKLFLGFLVAIALLTVFAISYVAAKFTKVDTVEIAAEELMINSEIAESIDFGDGYTNIAIFGVDSRDQEIETNTLSDSIIIVSLNNETKEIKMVSVYRDTLLNMTDGTYNKCNSAYLSGGPTQAINVLNTNLDLDIEKYVAVDFSIVVDIIDLLGGVELEIQDYEIDAINEYIPETAAAAGVEATLIQSSGYQMLNGVQATTYARIRSTSGSDFKRTDRQRYLIEQLVKVVQKTNLSTLNSIIDEVLPQISTNFTATEIALYAAAYMDFYLGDTTGFPITVSTPTMPTWGSVVVPVTLASNVEELHEFLFPEIAYSTSSQVQSNSYEIQVLTNSYVSASGVGDSNVNYDTVSEHNATNGNNEEYTSDNSAPGTDTNFNNPELVFNE